MTTKAKNTKLKIKKGDQVVVIAGASNGAKGEVLKDIPTESFAALYAPTVVAIASLRTRAAAMSAFSVAPTLGNSSSSRVPVS